MRNVVDLFVLVHLVNSEKLFPFQLIKSNVDMLALRNYFVIVILLAHVTLIKSSKDIRSI